MRILPVLYVLVSVGALLCAPLAPLEDSLTFRMTRPGFDEVKDSYYAPYTAWWIEDSAGNTVRTLFVTYYLDDGQNLSSACARPGYFPYLTTYYNKFGCPPDTGPAILPGNCPDYEPVDGITGCSEKSRAGVKTVVTKGWNLKDNSGVRVPPGTYTLFYNAVALDETYTPQDQIWNVSFTLGAASFDTLVPNPLPRIAGRIEVMTIDTFEVAFGGMSGMGADTVSPASRILNVTPAPPTAARPKQPGFCGSGSGFSIAFLLAFVAIRKRLKPGKTPEKKI